MSDRPEPRPVPWWGALLLPAVAYVGQIAAATAAVGIQAAAHGLSQEQAFHQVRSDPLNLGAIAGAGFGIALFVGLLLFYRGVRARDAFALRPVSLPVLFLALVAGLALQFPLAEVSNMVQELYPMSVEQQLQLKQLVTPEGPFEAVFTVLALVGVAALFEELLFRGLLLPGLAQSYGDTFALWVTAIIFGLMHMGHPSSIVYATLAGLILGTVAIRTRSTWPAIVLHAGVNSVPILLNEHVVRIDGFNTVTKDVYHLPLPILVGTGVVAAASLVGMAKLSDAEQP